MDAPSSSRVVVVRCLMRRAGPALGRASCGSHVAVRTRARETLEAIIRQAAGVVPSTQVGAPPLGAEATRTGSGGPPTGRYAPPGRRIRPPLRVALGNRSPTCLSDGAIVSAAAMAMAGSR